MRELGHCKMELERCKMELELEHYMMELELHKKPVVLRNQRMGHHMLSYPDCRPG